MATPPTAPLRPSAEPGIETVGRDDDRTGRRDGRDQPADEGETPLDRAMADVEPLDGPPTVVPRGGPAARRKALGGSPNAGERVRFETDRIGQRMYGLAPGSDPADLQRLRGGAVTPDLSVDLHGFPEREARGMVRDTVRRARRAGLRCVEVIHGRGRHSGGHAVLKEALPGWIEEPPLGSWVVAFASSPSHHGGSGSTLLLLRT